MNNNLLQLMQYLNQSLMKFADITNPVLIVAAYFLKIL